MTLIADKVKQLLADSNTQVIDILAKREADKTIEERASYVVKAIEEVEKLKREHDSIGMQKHYDADGNFTQFYPAESFNKRKKLSEQAALIEKEIELALGSANNFDPLTKRYGNSKGQDKGQS